MIGEHPTGPDLEEAIRAAAAKRGMTLKGFVLPLAGAGSGRADQYLLQLRRASKPTQSTIDRVLALIEGKPIPEARPSPRKGQSIRWSPLRERDGDGALKSDEIDRRRALTEAAHVARLPGETLHQAVKRVAAMQQTGEVG